MEDTFSPLPVLKRPVTGGIGAGLNIKTQMWKGDYKITAKFSINLNWSKALLGFGAPFTKFFGGFYDSALSLTLKAGWAYKEKNAGPGALGFFDTDLLGGASHGVTWKFLDKGFGYSIANNLSGYSLALSTKALQAVFFGNRLLAPGAWISFAFSQFDPNKLEIEFANDWGNEWKWLSNQINDFIDNNPNGRQQTNQRLLFPLDTAFIIIFPFY
jgi:hypothetical protein